MKWIINIMLLFVVFSNIAGKVELIKETNTEMEFIFQLPDYQSHLLEKEQKYYEYFETAEQTYYQETGYPFLPYFSTNVIIPDYDQVEIEILKIDYEEIKVSKILPAGNKADYSTLEFASIYESDEWYPSSWAELSNPYVFRDMRGVTIHFNPFRYNASANVVKVAKSISIKLKSVGVSEENILRFKPLETNSLFHSIYRDFFINYKQASSDNEGEMNIICPEKFANVIEPFIIWKNQKGIKTNVYYYPNDTGAHWRDIHSFLEQQYETTNLAYALFIGNRDMIPAFDEQLSDWEYGCLAGADFFPEIVTGRLPVSDETEANLMIQKIIQYEKNPLSHQPHLQGLLLSDNVLTEKRFPNKRKQKYETHHFLSEKMVADYFNAGLSWFMQTKNWISTDSFIESLTNTESFPIFISITDLTDPQKWAEQAEKMVQNQYSGEGAIAYLGFGKVGQKSRRMKIVVELLTSNNNSSIANLLLQTQLSNPIRLAEKNQEAMKSSLFYGDPSLIIQTNPVSELMVSYDNLISQEEQAITFTVRGVDGLLDDAIVALSQNGILLKSKRTDRFGVVKFALSDSVEERRLLDLTVTSANYIPYLGTIHVFEKEDYDPVVPVIKAEIFPNPFYAEGKHRSGFSNLLYELTERSQVRIAIYNSLGQLIKNVYEGEQDKGQYAFRWDGTDEFERKVASGTYLYMLEINQQVISKKMLLVK